MSYIIQSKKRFKDLEEAIYYLLNAVGPELEPEFELIEIRDEIRESLCGMIKNLWASEEKVSEEFRKLSESLTDPVQKQHAKILSQDYQRHKTRMYELTNRLNCWRQKNDQ